MKRQIETLSATKSASRLLTKVSVQSLHSLCVCTFTLDMYIAICAIERFDLHYSLSADDMEKAGQLEATYVRDICLKVVEVASVIG
jgi:hypothetical protein